MVLPENEKPQVSYLDTAVVDKGGPHSELHHVAVHGVVDNVQLFQRRKIRSIPSSNIKLTILQMIQMGRPPRLSSYQGQSVTLEIPWFVHTLSAYTLLPTNKRDRPGLCGESMQPLLAYLISSSCQIISRLQFRQF